MTAVRRPAALALAVLATGLLAACSQVSALAPVGGDGLAQVRYAALDVLIDQKVDLRTVPVCRSTGPTTVVCHGDTLDGTSVDVTGSPPTTAADGSQSGGSVVVTVGGRELFRGDVTDVLDRAAGSTP